MTHASPPTPPPLRALIVDDERLARRALRRLLDEHAGVEVVGEAGRIDEAAALVTGLTPDVVFLDVQMRGETGFDLFGRAPAGFHTIFVTAFDAYAVRAFEVNALDYLLKPVEPERLAEALARARGATAPAQAADEPAPPPDADHAFRYDDLFFVDEARRARFVRISDVVFIQAAGNYTELHFEKEPTALVSRTLSDWEARLPAEHFVRVHRATVVNLAFVERLERAPGYTYDLYLRGRAEPLPVSRRRAAHLRRQRRP